MNNTKIIRNKILNLTNTKKITKTMEMVAITKMKKVQKKLLINQPYLNIIKEIIFHFLHGKLQYKHPFFEKRKNINNIGIIVISSNRGLCGSLNNNIFKKVLSIMKEKKNKNIQSHLYIFGTKGSIFFNDSYNCQIHEKIFLQEDKVQYFDFIPLVNKLITCYKKKKIDELFIVSNKFHNNISQIPSTLQILPIRSKYFFGKKYTTYNHWDYLYEPNSVKNIDVILKKYILFQISQLFLENIISEQSSRRIAMKIATDNSQNVIQDLKILYNKIRQFSITQELIEIISGANTIS